MTRQKKSRNVGNNGQRHLPASEVRKTREPKEESKKKGAGLKSGSRNSQPQLKTPDNAGNAKKDPRLGSKKPIPLLETPVVTQAHTQVDPKLQPKAQLKTAKPERLTLEQELAAIEADERLQALLEQVEQDQVLSGKDAKYFNRQTARLTELLQLLGLDDTSDHDNAQDTEEDPLARFERTDWRKTLLGDED